jgi:hypothetical protein
MRVVTMHSPYTRQLLKESLDPTNTMHYGADIMNYA